MFSFGNSAFSPSAPHTTAIQLHVGAFLVLPTSPFPPDVGMLLGAEAERAHQAPIKTGHGPGLGADSLSSSPPKGTKQPGSQRQVNLDWGNLAQAEFMLCTRGGEKKNPSTCSMSLNVWEVRWKCVPGVEKGWPRALETFHCT